MIYKNLTTVILVIALSIPTTMICQQEDQQQPSTASSIIAFFKNNADRLTAFSLAACLSYSLLQATHTHENARKRADGFLSFFDSCGLKGKIGVLMVIRLLKLPLLDIFYLESSLTNSELQTLITAENACASLFFGIAAVGMLELYKNNKKTSPQFPLDPNYHAYVKEEMD